MSTPSHVASPLVSRESNSEDRAATPSHVGDRLPKWLREPLLHFALLGGLLFAVDQMMLTQGEDPLAIAVGGDVDAEARQLFEASRGRAPTDDELNALRQRWLDNEVLYREGLSMQVDRGDTAIRERVIFKALSVIDAGVKLPPVDDQLLRTWFEAHRFKYDDPTRYDFQEAVLSGDSSEAAVRSFVSMLNSGTPGDAKAGLRVFKGRPHSNLVQSYGADFPDSLAAAAPGEWRALATKDGWRAMRLDSIAQAKPADYESLRGVVMQDWKDATATEQRTAAVRALTAKYRVTYAPAQ